MLDRRVVGPDLVFHHCLLPYVARLVSCSSDETSGATGDVGLRGVLTLVEGGEQNAMRVDDVRRIRVAAGPPHDSNRELPLVSDGVTGRRKVKLRVSHRTRTGLDMKRCAPFEGVCADCPSNPNASPASKELRLPPFAQSGIDALTRCRGLTRREREVLTLCCGGAKNASIGRILGISLSAVRRHLRNLHRKTKTSDKAALILNLWHSCCVTPEAAVPVRRESPPPRRRPARSQRHPA